MESDTISKLFARNLKAAMDAANGGRGISQSALAGLTNGRVKQTTISLCLRPDDRPEGSPTLERVALLAAALRTEPWLLLHPNPAQAKRANDLIAEVRDEARKAPAPIKLDTQTQAWSSGYREGYTPSYTKLPTHVSGITAKKKRGTK